MRKKFFWLIPVFIILMACTCSVPAIIPSIKTPTASSPVGGRDQTTAEGFVTVRLSPDDGSLMTQLGSEVQKAAALGMKPFVEWDAEW
jgi:hypothetical protein